MRHTRSDLMRMALYTALGLFPNACGGRQDDSPDGQRSDAASRATAGETATQMSGKVTPTAPLASQSATPGSVAQPTTGVPTSTPPQASNTVAHPSAQLPSASAIQATQPSAPAPLSDSGVLDLPDGGPSPTGAISCGNSSDVDPASGLALCDSGLLHRSNANQCLSSLPRATVPGAASAAFAECTTDTECTAEPHGYCGNDGSLAYTYRCQYGCVSDSECKTDGACVCGDPVGHCVSATCRSDAECAPGMLCAQWTDPNGIGCPHTTFLSCQTPQDECALDSDCPQAQYGSYCSGESGTRKCVAIPGLACGRPFLVTGQARLAALIAGADWNDTRLALAAEELPPAQREHLGQRWAEIALMEHASIAAFARFTLQLLQVGAPSTLIVAAQQAMLDETAHARSCFSIASALLGRNVTAGPLPLEHALDALSLPELVRLSIQEGCVGETVAALEAAEAWAHADVPEIKAALGKIHVDEQSHAELAWRFVRWAIATGDISVRHAAEAEFAAIAAEASWDVQTRTVPAEAFNTLPFGLVPASLRVTLRNTAIRNVITPCAKALLRATSAVSSAGSDSSATSLSATA